MVDFSKQIEKLEGLVAERHDEVDIIKESCEKLVNSTSDATQCLRVMEKQLINMRSESTHKFSALERQLAMMTDTLARIEAKSFLDAAKRKMYRFYSSLQTSDSLRDTDDTQIVVREIYGVVANRESMLRKAEMSVFSGRSPFGWISRVERFFRYENFNGAEKLELVSMSLEGPVLYWFNGEMLNDLFISWSQFIDQLLDRFVGSIDDEPATRLVFLFSRHEKLQIV